MKKLLKLCSLLAFLLPTTARAYDFEIDGIYYDINGDEVTVTNRYSYPSANYSDVYTDHVIIPSSVTYNGDIFSVTSIGSKAFYWCNQLSDVTIPNSVRSIGSDSFSGCTGLTSIEIPNSVTFISDHAFDGCTGLISIEIPNSITFIGNYAFSGCTGLTSIEIPDSVTYIGIDAFSSCTGLTSIEIPNSITSILGDTFKDCTGLTSIEIPNSVTYIGSYAFSGCTGLTSIEIPNSVTYIGSYTFNGCTGLTSIEIPNSITSIGANAFKYCDNLKELTWNAKNCSNGGMPISSVEHVTIGPEVEVLPIDFVSFSKITEVVIPNSVVNIEKRAFRQCRDLKSVTIGNSVANIGDEAFSVCDVMTSVVIPNSVTTIGNEAFYLCRGLTNITLGNSISSIGDAAFNGCTGLTCLTIPKTVTKIGIKAFCGCSSLTSITVESDNQNYDSRYNCNAIIESSSNTLISGCQNSFIPKTVTAISNSAFIFCNDLTNIDIPSSVTLIGDSAFAFCSELISIDLPNSVTSIGKEAFRSCTMLNSITIPNSLTYIGYRAFYNCNRISTLMITGEGEWKGVSLYSIISSPKLYVDSHITGLCGANIPHKDVYCYAAIPPICDDSSFRYYTGTLHVPASSLAAYFTSNYWSNFENIVGDAVEVDRISINKDSIDVNLGDRFNLTASISPNNANPNYIIWRSSNDKIASVNYNGMVTAIGVGECDIIAECLYTSAFCHVVVKDTTITITLDQQEAMVLPNHIITLTPSASPIIPDLSISSSDPSVAAARLVNNKIQVVGIKEGTTTITVGSADGTAIPATCLVTVYTEPGDLNSDGYVTISDVTSLIDYLLGGDETSITTKNADVNGDGSISISDVTTLIDTLLSGN